MLVFAYLWRRESAEHLRYWTLGFMLQIVAQVSVLPVVMGHPLAPLQVLSALCVFGATVLLLLGTWKLLGRKPDGRWWLGGMLGVFGVSAVLATGGTLLHASIVPAGFLSFAYFSMGLALFRQRREMSGLGVSLTIFAATAIGLHFLDFPFLGDAPWFVPWGLGIALFDDVTLSVGLVVLTFDRTRAARTLADTIGVGTYTATSPMRFNEVNGALVRMLGYGSAAELLAAGLPFSPIPSSGEVLTGFNATWQRKDGRPLMVQLHARVVRDEVGQVSGCRGFVVDRTEAHAIEEALSRTQKLDAVGRLAGGVAHDFNNLLTIILSSLELLALKPNDPSALRDAMEATEQAARCAACSRPRATTRARRAPGTKRWPWSRPVNTST